MELKNFKLPPKINTSKLGIISRNDSSGHINKTISDENIIFHRSSSLDHSSPPVRGLIKGLSNNNFCSTSQPLNNDSVVSIPDIQNVASVDDQYFYRPSDNEDKYQTIYINPESVLSDKIRFSLIPDAIICDKPDLPHTRKDDLIILSKKIDPCLSKNNSEKGLTYISNVMCNNNNAAISFLPSDLLTKSRNKSENSKHNFQSISSSYVSNNLAVTFRDSNNDSLKTSYIKNYSNPAVELNTSTPSHSELLITKSWNPRPPTEPRTEEAENAFRLRNRRFIKIGVISDINRQTKSAN